MRSWTRFGHQWERIYCQRTVHLSLNFFQKEICVQRNSYLRKTETEPRLTLSLWSGKSVDFKVEKWRCTAVYLSECHDSLRKTCIFKGHTQGHIGWVSLIIMVLAFETIKDSIVYQMNFIFGVKISSHETFIYPRMCLCSPQRNNVQGRRFFIKSLLFV